MLETIHDLAEEQLEASSDRGETRAAHAAWFVDLAARARSDIPNLQAARLELIRRWAETLEEELDNLRAASRWLIDDAQRGDALRLADAMPLLWGRGGHDAEAERFYAEALNAEGPARDEVEARVLMNRGLLLVMADHMTEAEPCLERALRTGRSIGDGWLTDGSLRGLAWIAHGADDLDGARVLFEEALAETPDDSGLINTLLQGLGSVETDAGNLERARELLGRAVADSRQAGQFLVGAFSLCCLADVDRLEGFLDRADEGYKESLNLVRAVTWNRTTWTCVAGLAATALARGNLYRAGRLWAATLSGLDEHDTKMFPPSRRRLASLLDGRTEAEYLRGFEEGRMLIPEESIQDALEN